MVLSRTEENYLKSIYKIAERSGSTSVSTNAISKEMENSAASVTDMLKKLSDKGLVTYQKYKGVNLSDSGKKISTQLIRNHRLWEVFLVEKLNYKWDEVHEIAEELEHIHAEDLINKLDAFLDFPRYDPHGDPIPNAEGKFTIRHQISLKELDQGISSHVIGVREHSKEFLQYLNEIGIALGKEIRIREKMPYDDSVLVEIEEKDFLLSGKVAHNIFVSPK